MAPEVLLSQEYTEKVDLYSYGLILWQIYTGLTPFPSLRPNMFKLVVATNKERPPLNNIRVNENMTINATPEPLARVIQSCWADSPDDRFSADELVAKLNAVIYQQVAVVKVGSCSICWGAVGAMLDGSNGKASRSVMPL